MEHRLNKFEALEHIFDCTIQENWHDLNAWDLVRWDAYGNANIIATIPDKEFLYDVAYIIKKVIKRSYPIDNQ